MQIEGIRVISPLNFPQDPWNEAEILGGLVWLWGRHNYYCQGSIESALNILIPIIQSRKFCFFIKDSRPLGYFNWNNLDKQDEHDYIHKIKPYEYFINLEYPESTPTRIWALSYFFPQGGIQLSRNILRKHIFKNQTVHLAYHKSPKNKAIIKAFSGISLQSS